jgi:CheY-like chemotaxis protein
MEALGKLAGGIAHDFNNVLQAIQGGISLIERRPTDLESVRRLTRMVMHAAERGATITHRLLAFSRRGDLRAEPVNPTLLLTEIREILSHTLGTGIEVRLALPPALPTFSADKGQLETVLINLATNARDAMSGSGLLTLAAGVEQVRSADPRRNPPGLDNGAYLCISVTDTGAGMPPEVLGRATEPFFTTKSRGKGTGLGLAMARGFAEQSGGGLQLDSAPGRGTTVRLWFPLAAGQPAAPPSDAAPPQAAPKYVRLMLVDDDPIVRQLLIEQLGVEGFDIVSADRGATALALLDAGERVDLIVSDFSMPGMDGLATIRGAQQRRPGLPAILLTGFATETAELAYDGTFSLLRKPVTARQLAEHATALLDATAPATI